MSSPVNFDRDVGKILPNQFNKLLRIQMNEWTMCWLACFWESSFSRSKKPTATEDDVEVADILIWKFQILFEVTNFRNFVFCVQNNSFSVFGNSWSAINRRFSNDGVKYFSFKKISLMTFFRSTTTPVLKLASTLGLRFKVRVKPQPHVSFRSGNPKKSLMFL